MLPTYSDGLVTLVGDAVSNTLHPTPMSVLAEHPPQAHAMSPHQGAGAGVGFEVRVMILQPLIITDYSPTGRLHSRAVPGPSWRYEGNRSHRPSGLRRRSTPGLAECRNSLPHERSEPALQPEPRLYESDRGAECQWKGLVTRTA